MLGHADVERGEVTFEGRRYHITHGTMDFTNPTRIEPFFDVEAETNVRVPGQTYRVTVALAGTSEQLRPTFNSDPPLPTADVLALLFSNVQRTGTQDIGPELRALRDPNQTQTDILTTRATQAITSGLSSEVGKVVEQTFGVDTFQLTPSFIDPYSQQTSRAQPDGAADDRQADLRARLPDVLAQPGHDDQRSDRAARDRGERSHRLDSVAQRGSADLRARVPCETRLLMVRARLSRVILAAFSVLCAGVLPAAAAVADYLGKPIGSVHLVIEGRETTELVLTQIVSTVAGQPLSMIQVRETVAHLFSLGRFEDVSVDAALEDGRVALRYELIPIHPIARFRFDGPLAVPGIDQGELRRAIVDRYGVSPPLGRAADMTRIIADALRERGYLNPTVTPRPVLEHAPERATLVFTIDPGPRTTIGEVEIVGTPTISRGEFLGRLGVAAGAPYQREALNARIEKYIDERRSKGYYEAKILPVVRLSADQRTADLTLTVVPGPRVRVVFTGDPLPSDRRAELVPVEREGSVDEDLLEDSSNRIEEYLRALGYRDARAPHAREEKNGELVITFAVTRGQQFKVASYEISGNASLPLPEFESLLRLRDGQPFASTALDADVQVIEDVYHRRGFAAARVATAVEIVTRTPPPAQVPVAVRAVISEGPSTTVDAVTFAGNEAVAESDAPRASEPPSGRAVRAGTARRGPRHHSAGLSGSRLRERVGRRAAELQPERYPRRGLVRDPGRAPGVRRPRADRRQRADDHQHHRARAAGEGRRSVQSGRDQREPAAADRARPVPARAHHRAAPRRRDDPRPAGHGRGGAADHHRLRRRLRGRSPHRRSHRRRCRHRTVRLRAAGVLRGRPPQCLRQEPVAELLLEPGLPLRTKLDPDRVPADRDLPRTAGVRHRSRRVRERDGRTAAPIELQLFHGAA